MIALSLKWIALLPLLWVISNVLTYRKVKRRVGNWPGMFNFISPTSFVGVILGRIMRKRSVGRITLFQMRHKPFEKSGWNILSIVSAYPAAAVWMLADADAIHQITHDHAKFPKPAENYKGLARFGNNIVTTEGDDWRRHRKVSAPAFSERNNRLVWDTTIGIMNDLFEQVWDNKSVVEVPQFLEYTVNITLMVLSNAGYGIPMGWKSDQVVPKGHTMTFRETLEELVNVRGARRGLPKWFLKFGKDGRRALGVDEEMKIYLKEIVASRMKETDKAERWDLLSNITQGGEAAMLTPSELLGNVYVYLIAGHETTATALAYVMILLAIYPEEQDKLYTHIKDVIGEREPVYEDHSKLTRVIACFYEALRLYPIVQAVPKRAAEDVVLTCTRADPDDPTTAPIMVKKGSMMMLNIPAVQYNPRYWKNPNAFKPERFMGEWNHNALLAFSGGARACIGRKFSETEAVAAITMIFSRFQVSLKEGTRFENETPDQVRAKILKNDFGAFMARPVPIPLVFTKRV